MYFVFLSRSIAEGSALFWFGVCLLARGLYGLCVFYFHFGSPVVSGGIAGRLAGSLFGLNFIFAIDFLYAMFRRRVPSAIRCLQAANVCVVLVQIVYERPTVRAVAFDVAAYTAVVISIIGSALAAMEVRRRSAGARAALSLFSIWVFVTSSYLFNQVFSLPVPVRFELASFTIFYWDFSMFLWIPAITVTLHSINQRLRDDRERLRGEMEAARHVQELLVPAESVRVPGFEVDASYRPATEVGGDFFQLFAALPSVDMSVDVRRPERPPQDTVLPHLLSCRGSKESLLVVVGDVSGKGMKAALLVSVIVGAVVELEPGDRVLWVSDGVIEARNGKRDLLGFERVQELAGRSAAEIVRAAQQFGQEDDITVVSVTRQPVAVYVA
jgi:hypothetical protein